MAVSTLKFQETARLTLRGWFLPTYKIKRWKSYKICFQSDNFSGLIDAIRIYFGVFYNSSVFHYPDKILKIYLSFLVEKMKGKMYSGSMHVHTEE